MLNLALTDLAGGHGHFTVKSWVAHAGGQFKRVAEQEIAQQHRGLMAPARMDGWHVPTRVGIVENIVVHQRGGVHQFDGSGQIDVRWLDRARGASHQKRQQRTETLATVLGDMIDDATQALWPAGQNLLNTRFNTGHLGAHEVAGVAFQCRQVCCRVNHS